MDNIKDFEDAITESKEKGTDKFEKAMIKHKLAVMALAHMHAKEIGKEKESKTKARASKGVLKNA